MMFKQVKYDLAMMRLGCHDNPNVLYADGVGLMVVSIYTLLGDNAKNIATKAGKEYHRLVMIHIVHKGK